MISLSGKTVSVKVAYYLSTLLSVGVLGAVFFAPVPALADAPNIVLSQGQLPATSTETANGNVSEWSVSVGNGYSGDIGSLIIGIGGVGSAGAATEAHFANAFFGEVRQASTTGNPYLADSYCYFAASTTEFSHSGFNANDGLLSMHVISQSNNGCTLRADYYTAVQFYVYRNHVPTGYWADYSYGSVTNDKGYHWTRAITSAIDCEDDPTPDVSCNTTWYPYFNVLGAGWSLVPTTTTSGVFFSGAVAFCNDAFASSTGIGSTIGNGLCIAAGYLFIPTSDSVSSFQGIPNQIGQSFPFSYITQIRGVLSAASASSSENFINLSLPLGTTTRVLGFTTLEVISTSTLSHYLSDTNRNAVKALLSAVFYLMAAAFIYREIQKIWQTA